MKNSEAAIRVCIRTLMLVCERPCTPGKCAVETQSEWFLVLGCRAGLALPMGTGRAPLLGSKCLQCQWPESPGTATCAAMAAFETAN